MGKIAWSKIFGTYEAPEWMKAIGRFFFRNKAGFKKARKIALISLASLVGLIVLAVAGLFAWAFISSKMPLKMEIGYSVEEPDLLENAKDPLVISFNGSAAKIDDADKIVAGGIAMKPDMAGEWRWSGSDELVFTPSEPWPLGTQYQISFSKKDFADHVKIRSYTAKFSTDDFYAEIEDEEFCIDAADPAKKYISFSLRANFPINSDGIEKLVSLSPDMKNPKSGTFEKRSYTVTAGLSDDKRTAFFASEPLGVPAKDVTMNIAIAAGIKSASGGSPLKKMTASVTVPGSSSYAKIESIDFTLVKNDAQEYEQVIAIETTAKISADNLQSALSVYELPQDKPAEPGRRGEKDYEWYSEEEVTDTVIKNSKALSFTALPSELEYDTMHSFVIDAKPGAYLYVAVKDGAKFYGDYYLTDPYEEVVKVRSYPKETTILSDGTIISMRGSKKIPVLTRGVDKVYYTVWRMQSDEINHIASMSNGDMKNFSFNYDYIFNQNNVSAVYRSDASVAATSAKKPSYTNFDFSGYLNSIPSQHLKYGLFLFRVSSEKNGSGDERLILVTDQGIIVKKNADKTCDVFVQSIATGRPVAGSEIRVVALNGDTLASGVTASDGHVTLPSLSMNNKEHRPVAYTAINGGDFAFMPYADYGRSLDYSDFNTGGEYGALDPDAIHTYIFSDRGIYRPGDTAKLGLIVKAGDWAKNLAGTPLAYVVTDPNGTEIVDKEFALNDAGFEEIKFATQSYSPTGEYNVSAYFRKQRSDGKIERVFLGNETVKVEEFLPDTLSISTAFDPLPASGWIRPAKLTGVVKLRNLFGTAAAGNKVSAEISLAPGYMRFPQYRGYVFSDPYTGKDSYTETLDEKTTDDEGRAEFALDVEKFAKASYRMTFTADGYEKGSGRAVSSQSSVYVSPLEYLIGVKADGDLSYIKKDSARELTLIAVGPDLKQRAMSGVELAVTENRYVSVLVKQPNGAYKYQSVKKEYPVFTKTVTIPEAGLKYRLPVSTEGDFTLTLKNGAGLEFNKTPYSVIGEKNLQRSLSRTAELEVKMEKSDFRPGETAQIFIKAPYAGSGLIAVERDKVYTYKWFRSDGASSLQSIAIPQGLEGNGYITIMYARSYDSEEIYMSPFCYAAVPFSVSLERRTNEITLDVAREAKPGTDYTISYSSKRPGKIVVMAIDEGILQVAHYKTPDPLAYFFKKRALEVSTSQVLDLVLPEYNILRTLAAAGGGGDYELLAHNLNPFKRKQNEPVAYWSGIVDTGPQKRNLTYRIPDYFNGSLRVMAVAVSSESIGVAQASSEIKDTYVIVPNAPTFASPGDTFDISVTVTNNDKGSGSDASVVLSAVPTAHFSITSAQSVTLKIPEGRDATATFGIKTNDVLGAADIAFTAKGASHSSRITSSMSVRPSMPYQVRLTSGRVTKDKASVDVDKKMYNEYATREIALSYLPSGLAKGLQFYLEKYPYGCSEQQVSMAYPYLFPDLLKESGKTKADAQEAIDNVVAALQSRQKSDGSIGFWTHRSESWAALDAYCAMFLTDARENGYYVPDVFFNNLLGVLKKRAADTDGGVYGRAFCVYVLTRNETVTTDYINSLRKDMDRDDKASVAGVFLAASYKMLGMASEGEKLVSRVKRGGKTADSIGFFEDDLYFKSAYLYLISEYYPEKLSAVSAHLLESIEDEIVHRRYASLSAAMTLIAIKSYLAAMPTSETGKFTVAEESGKTTKTLTPQGEKVFTAEFSSDAQKLRLTNDEKTNLFYQVTQGGFLHDIPSGETKDGIEVYREFVDANGKKIDAVKLGDEVTVKVNVRSTKNRSILNVAVVDMLPCGLEADIASIRESDTGWNPDYVDIREDRIVLFGTVTQELKTFTYKVRAVNSGKYTVPPLFAEAMYDGTQRALRPQKSITISDK